MRVHFQVVEGSRRRTQVFEGVVIKRQGHGVRETFTVRKQSFGVGRRADVPGALAEDRAHRDRRARRRAPGKALLPARTRRQARAGARAARRSGPEETIEPGLLHEPVAGGVDAEGEAVAEAESELSPDAEHGEAAGRRRTVRRPGRRRTRRPRGRLGSVGGGPGRGRRGPGRGGGGARGRRRSGRREPELVLARGGDQAQEVHRRLAHRARRDRGRRALALALVIQAFLVKPYRIPSESMEPTLDVGQRVLVDRIGNRFGDPSVGDIVVFHPPQGSETNQCGAPVGAGPGRARARRPSART